MKFFSYYALHSFKNQLKKLFKTWVLLFIVACMVIGGIIGIGVAMIEDMAESQKGEPAHEEVIEEQGPSLPERLGIETQDLIELIAGFVILAVFAFEAISADKNGSKIFLPADVNLLFASPMKPQSVLMFRLMTQMGTAIVASLYLLFQIPNLTLNLGMSVWAALAVIATWCFTVIIGKLIQVLLYTVTSNRPSLKQNLRRAVYLLFALLAAAFFVFWKQTGLRPLNAAVLFFNGKASRFLPFWGWLKGFCMFAMEGNPKGALLSLGALFLGGGVLIYIIWHVKADFYEDAMAKSEETAALLEAMRSEKSTGLVKRKKDRSDKLKRDAMRHGWGANVFFFKSLYNRFRFAHFGIFTKTTETYLVAAAATSLFFQHVVKTDGLIPVVLTLAGLSFFRSLGNPLEQDTKMDYFILIPESTWAKLFWSLLGGTVNCLLDVLPAILLSVVLLGANPLIALAWIPFILSVDFFATNVGTFIGLSVPVSAGKTLKQIVQIMFIYFGLLPDVAIMAVGLVLGHTTPAAIAAAALNFGLGFLFFGLSPLFLDPRDGKKQNAPLPFQGELKQARKQFSRLGLSTFLILALGSVLQILLMNVLNAVWPAWTERTWAIWLCTFAPVYLIAVPVGLLLLRRAPAAPVKKHSLKAGQYIVIAIICIFLLYAGNIVGAIVTTLLQWILDIPAVNPLLSYVMNESLLPKILVVVVLAPVIEEYIFRKQLIDRMNIYGEKLAVVTSAVMFGLFHGNLSQLFYAFALGLAFGYVYLKTGKLRYSIGLHMFINFMGSVIGPAILQNVDLSSLETMDAADPAAWSSLFTPGVVVFLTYLLLIIGLAVTGLVLLCVKARNISFSRTELELPKGLRFKTVYLNLGMLLLVAGCVALIVMTFI